MPHHGGLGVFDGSDDTIGHGLFIFLKAAMDRNDDIIEEIKRRVDIVAIVSRYVTLTRAGRRMRSRCPFHEETQPSARRSPIINLRVSHTIDHAAFASESGFQLTKK